MSNLSQSSPPLLPSFALIGSYSPFGDSSLFPSALAVLIPTSTTGAYITPNTPLYVFWNCTNIVKVRITGDNNVDPAVDSGFINTTGLASGSFDISTGLTHDTNLKFEAYDTDSHLLTTQILFADYGTGGIVGVSISPLNPSIPVGTTQQFMALANYADGSTAPLRSPMWSSSDSTNATINSSGLATGLLANSGGSVITATWNSVSTSTQLNIVALKPLVVQMAHKGEVVIPSGTVTTTNPVTMGNFLVGMVSWRPGSVISAHYFDSLGNIWTTQTVPPPPVGSPPTGAWYNYGLGYAPVTIGGIDTVHDSIAGGPFSFIYNVNNNVVEFGNIDSFEGGSWASDPTGTSPVSISYTPSSGETYTFNNTTALNTWYANISSYTKLDSPGTRMLLAFISSNDQIPESEIIPGWTLLYEDTFFSSVYYQIVWSGD